MANTNEVTPDYGDEGNVRFLHQTAFDRQIPTRVFPFISKITDIDGGPLLPPEPHLKLVVDGPVMDNSPFYRRIISWVGNVFSLASQQKPVDDFHNQLSEDYIVRIMAKRGMRP